jgi:hypothetical protein
MLVCSTGPDRRDCPGNLAVGKRRRERDSMTVMTFEEALGDAERYKARPHVLLGNGFSIACRPNSFTYGVLLGEATFDGGSTDLRQVFELLGTTDFERVIELLELAAVLCEAYDADDPDLTDRLRGDAEVVRDALAQVLASKHPDGPYEIGDDEYRSARIFLANFARIYTVNYDMLLYWTVMQDMEPQTERNDGFGNPEDEDAPYVIWNPYDVYGSQKVFYLHGSLHLYDRGPELAKITWSRTQIPLIDQIRASLAEDRYPLIVTEGTSQDKLSKILHSAYLNHAIRSFARIQGSLFIYGLSLAPNDEHLLRRIAEGQLKAIYVSLYGDPESLINREIMRAARELADHRSGSQELAVSFFDAKSAEVWSD